MSFAELEGKLRTAHRESAAEADELETKGAEPGSMYARGRAYAYDVAANQIAAILAASSREAQR